MRNSRSILALPGWQSTSGSNNPSAILDEPKVRRILRSRRTNEALAKHFGVSKQTISDVRLGRRWRKVYMEEIKRREEKT
jgi:uncharacterized protein YerC